MSLSDIKFHFSHVYCLLRQLSILCQIGLFAKNLLHYQNYPISAQKQFLRLPLFILLTYTPFLQGAERIQSHNGFTIEHGGSRFYSYYQLKSKKKHSPLCIEMVVGARNTEFTKIIGAGGVIPGPFSIWWNIKKQHHSSTIATLSGNSPQNLIVLNQKITSAWREGFQFLATNIAPHYFLAEKNLQAPPLNSTSLTFPISFLKPLSKNYLESLEHIYKDDYRYFHSELDKGAVIQVKTFTKKDRHRKKRIFSQLIVQAATPKAASIIFVKTTSGVKVVFKKNMKHLTIWSPLMKQIAKTNIEKYKAYKKINNFFKEKYVQQKST